MNRNPSRHAHPLLAAALMAMFGVAAAQSPEAGSTNGATGMAAGSRMMGPGDAAAFSALDKSNRGYLQRNDVTGLPGFSFDAADVNHDGRISQDEFAHWQSHHGHAGGAMGQGSDNMSNPGMPARPGAAGSSAGATR